VSRDAKEKILFCFYSDRDCGLHQIMVLKDKLPAHWLLFWNEIIASN
jgi:hypothetical protein